MTHGLDDRLTVVSTCRAAHVVRDKGKGLVNDGVQIDRFLVQLMAF